jgi:hypothetical protein
MAINTNPTAPPPLVSIVIPAYNAAETLAETAHSALASTYRQLELIVVDDGSTDATAAIARQLAKEDSRVRLVQRSNGGLPAALNSGFRAAGGEYVARLDADDLWHPEKLARQMHFAAQRPDTAFIYTFYRYMDADGRVFRDGPQQRFPPWSLCRGVYETLIGTGSSVLMKRSAVEEVGGCDETYRNWEDLLLQLKISARYPVTCIPEYLVGYRLSASSLSQKMWDMLSTWRQLRLRIRELFPQVPRRVHDWGHARRCAEMAESFAWRGDYRKCAALLLSAMRHDPAWASAFLTHRAGRSVRRRLLHRRTTAIGPHFFDCDPGSSMRVDPYGPPAVGGAVAGIERRRRRRLETLDQLLAKHLRAEAVEGTNQQAPGRS